MAKKTTKEINRLKELWMLLFEDPESLDDKQIKSLLAAEDELKDILYDRKYWFPVEYKKVLASRIRRKELSRLSTEELRTKYQAILDQRASVIKRVPEGEISDSFFEDPPIDSDRHILYELLKDRDTV